MDPFEAQAHKRRQQRGSALLLSLLLTVVGAALLGLTVDATSLLWARSNAQTTANLTAASVQRELERNPSAPPSYLEEAARSTAAHNGFRHGLDSAAVRLEKQQDHTDVLVERKTGVFFLRMIQPEPILIRARASVESPGAKASR